ncbi:protein FAM124A isoform X2 [Dunckerocampus dactyliophorus]|uniref:protein FAM124A isoform X2 n=1 Tax=Dunckerocampus dactyliophorus TaxID=161453 RepID=UPI002406DE02|nr:protein FAM124A isoform X2 [Dunckerocampus dactyliophorus]
MCLCSLCLQTLVRDGPHEWSDYSPLSSTSSDVSMGELQDPFLVSVHLIADPGEGLFLQRAADGILAWVHPELQLFKVSERAGFSRHPRPKRHHSGVQAGAPQPALAVILFLQEGCGGEEPHRSLRRPPWRHHHSEEVSGGRRMLPLAPSTQDFFTLAPGTPLWAVRQVHYGKEIVRFTLYCCHDNYADTVRLYKLLLQRRLAQKKQDFCFLVVYSNPDMEIQLSFKRLPRGQRPAALDSAVMEVRVRDVGALVPLLPNPCSPISDVRWQTEDYDGNKILLQVQGVHFKLRHDPTHIADSSLAQPAFTWSSASYRSHRHRHHHRSTSRPRVHHHQVSVCSLPLCCEEDEGGGEWFWRDWCHPSRGRGQRSNSLFSLPNLGSSSSTCSSPGPSPASPRQQRCSSLIPPFRLNVDALFGAEETDVDTGNKVQAGGVDLTVVSAYVQTALEASRPPPAPPEHIAENNLKVATFGRTHVSAGTKDSPTVCQPLSDDSTNNDEDHQTPAEKCTQDDDEDDQEFYI